MNDIEICIPYVVLRELDSLKAAGDGNELRLKASKANTLIYSWVQNKNVRLQSLAETTFNRTNTTSDDAILECIIQYYENYVVKVVLLTHDVNFILKATANCIPTLRSLPADKDSLTIINLLKDTAKSIQRSDGHSMEWEPSNLQASTVHEEDTNQMDYESLSPLALQEQILKAVEATTLEQALRHILTQRFGKVEVWTSLIQVPPSPWPVDFMLNIIDKHWNAAFASTIHVKVRPICAASYKEIVEARSRVDGSLTFKKVALLASKLQQILSLFSIKSPSLLNGCILRHQ